MVMIIYEYYWRYMIIVLIVFIGLYMCLDNVCLYLIVLVVLSLGCVVLCLGLARMTNYLILKSLCPLLFINYFIIKN